MAKLSLVVPVSRKDGRRIGRRTFRPEEAAQYLGVSRSTVYREVAAGRLPSIRIRTRLLIPEFALDRWIEAQVTGCPTGDAAVSRPTPPGLTVSDGRFPGGARRPAPGDRPEGGAA